MKPPALWMLIVSIFALGFYVGRTTTTRAYADGFVATMYLFNTVMWGWLRHREHKTHMRESRKIIEEIKRRYGG